MTGLGRCGDISKISVTQCCNIIDNEKKNRSILISIVCVLVLVFNACDMIIIKLLCIFKYYFSLYIELCMLNFLARFSP